jgi:tRNA nucleotidyltransferase/poly(A) polymerase
MRPCAGLAVFVTIGSLIAAPEPKAAMPALPCDPAAAREFAIVVVDRLRKAGHEALWAGGCVRDELIGRTPADYDVATSARPEQVRAVFGNRNTLSVGAAFGVITVLGPRGAGQVEVATFRSDAAYTDGRHPAGVTFTNAREDALRRDFTINGLFLDPITGAVHDYVAGRADLAAGIVRAIGTAAMRFGEDHLRMLRAVRFAAVFGFALEEQTRAAIVRMAHLVTTVSPERIAAELRAMLSRPGRRRALELLAQTGLAREVLPEVAPADGSAGDTACGSAAHTADEPTLWHESARIIDALDEPELASSLAILTATLPVETPRRIAARLRLSTRELKTACWLHEAVAAVAGSTEADISQRPWSQLQPWLAHDAAFLLADVLRARAACGHGSETVARWVTATVQMPREQLDPPPLLTGNELLAAGVPAGRSIGQALASLRALQLDDVITTRDAALEWVRAQESGGGMIE